MKDDRTRIMDCLEENGIIVNQDGELPEIESVMFIEMILSIESEFGIEFPDEQLNISFFSSIDDILNMINEMNRKR